MYLKECCNKSLRDKIGNKTEYGTMHEMVDQFRFSDSNNLIALPVMMETGAISDRPMDFIRLLDTIGKDMKRLFNTLF